MLIFSCLLFLRQKPLFRDVQSAGSKIPTASNGVEGLRSRQFFEHVASVWGYIKQLSLFLLLGTAGLLFKHKLLKQEVYSQCSNNTACLLSALKFSIAVSMCHENFILAVTGMADKGCVALLLSARGAFLLYLWQWEHRQWKLHPWQLLHWSARVIVLPVKL